MGAGPAGEADRLSARSVVKRGPTSVNRNRENFTLGRRPPAHNPTSAIELAKRRMLTAQSAFERYIESGIPDIKQHKKLAEALRNAIDEFIEKLSLEYPR